MSAVILPLPLQPEERHWTIKELAARWNFSSDTLREWFENAPGVVQNARPEQTHWKNRKRRYVSIRIPESVALRVYREHQRKGLSKAA